MDGAELKVALRSGRPVEWKGPMSYDYALGTVTAIILRSVHGKDVLSAEITSFSLKSVVTCRADEIEYYKGTTKQEGFSQ